VKKKYKILFLFLILLQCGNNIPYSKETLLKRPVGVSIVAKSGLAFDLSYHVQNEEDTFDGYNVYISRDSISDSEIETLVPALNLSGSLPTFQHSKDEVDFVNSVTQNIALYSDSITNFENGVTYFFRIAAHSRYGYLSKASNEVSAAAFE